MYLKLDRNVAMNPALCYKRAVCQLFAMTLHVQSTGSQSLFFPHVMSSPTNQVEEQEYLHPGGRGALEEYMTKSESD